MENPHNCCCCCCCCYCYYFYDFQKSARSALVWKSHCQFAADDSENPRQ